jgi:hypothetical protein
MAAKLLIFAAAVIYLNVAYFPIAEAKKKTPRYLDYAEALQIAQQVRRKVAHVHFEQCKNEN